jgi:hypothetical protein
MLLQTNRDIDHHLTVQLYIQTPVNRHPSHHSGTTHPSEHHGLLMQPTAVVLSGTLRHRNHGTPCCTSHVTDMHMATTHRSPIHTQPQACRVAPLACHRQSLCHIAAMSGRMHNCRCRQPAAQPAAMATVPATLAGCTNAHSSRTHPTAWPGQQYTTGKLQAHLQPYETCAGCRPQRPPQQQQTKLQAYNSSRESTTRCGRRTL